MLKDEKYMHICLGLASLGYPNALPNPLVGSVIVYNDEVIGKGYHAQYGSHHAEVNAINSVEDKSLLKKSTLYVNLEPCSHTGKTPPCADLIIKYKIPKVVIGCLDTYSKVSGKGIQKLENAGIEVITGVLKDDCISINRRFFTFHDDKRPYIILKWAQTNDGFMAPLKQDKPYWISSPESKELVHQWRAVETAILVGYNTALKDNPSLTVREIDGKNPIRFVIDKDNTLPKNLKVFNSHSPTLVITENKSEENHIKVDFNNFIEDLLPKLYNQSIYSIIIEGGAKTLSDFINSNAWDEARVFTSENNLKEGLKSPVLGFESDFSEEIGTDTLHYYLNK